MSCISTNRRLAVALTLLPVVQSLSAWGGQAEFPVQMAEPSPFFLWDSSLSLRTSGGFSSNPTLACDSCVEPEDPTQTARQPASFFEYGGDLMFFRLPSDGNTAYFILSGDDRRYVAAEEVPGQQNFLSQFKFEHESPSGWTAGGTFDFLYANQVFSLPDLNPIQVGVAQLQGRTLSLTPNFGTPLSEKWNLGFELPFVRQDFTDSADGFYDLGPQFLLTRELPNGSSVSIGYSWTWRRYDDLPLLTYNGEIVVGTQARLHYNNVNVRWRQYLNEDKSWSMTLFTGFTAVRDNGTAEYKGYYDYNRYRTGASLHYQVGRWTLSAEGGAAWYDYLVQTIDVAETAIRNRQEFTAEVEARYDITKSVQWVLRFSWEDSISNAPRDVYESFTGSGGFEFEF